MKLLSVWIACIALAAILLVEIRRHPRPAGTSPVAAERAAQDPRPVDLDPSTDLPRAALGPEGDPTPPARERPRLSPSELLERLRAVARAYAGGDVPALEANLEDLLRDPRDALAVLDRLRRGGLRSDAEALRGAVMTLTAGVTLYNQPDWSGPPDGRAFLTCVLDALPDVLSPELEDLVDGIAEARAGDRAILDLSWLAKILELRAAHPELAPTFSLLLANVAEDLRGTEGFERFYALLLGETADPMAVKVSLAALLSSQPEAFLPLAEEMFARARSDPGLAGAITQAIASSAPVAEAAAALARLTDGSQYLEFATLGARGGALDALQAEYSALAAGGENARARKMLVSGMAAEKEEVLLGIAGTDPDPRVRLQALLTGSLGREVGTEFLSAVAGAYGRRGDPANDLSASGAVLVADNILRASPGESREGAKKLLLEIAADASLVDADRFEAIAALRPWVSADTFQGWVIGGQTIR
jgi:hypothetical protein